jgi:thiol-disulfide isomerase/thioredoxin
MSSRNYQQPASRAVRPAPEDSRRQPLPARPIADDYEYEDEPVAPRNNTPLILAIVGGGAVIALVLIVMIASNMSRQAQASAYSPPPGVTEDVVPGALAANFVATTLDGQQVHLSDYRGKKAVWLNFWASWCGPCKAEMPDMEQLYQANKDKDLAMLGFDVREEKPTVQGFVTQQGFHWLFLLEPSGATADRYVVTGIPTHVFINKQGIITYRVSGGIPRQDMEKQLANILSQ